jgi:hypothetical protein
MARVRCTAGRPPTNPASCPNRRIFLAKNQPEAIAIHPFAITQMADDFVRRPLAFKWPRAQDCRRMSGHYFGQGRCRLAQHPHRIPASQQFEQPLAIGLRSRQRWFRLRRGHSQLLPLCSSRIYREPSVSHDKDADTRGNRAIRMLRSNQTLRVNSASQLPLFDGRSEIGQHQSTWPQTPDPPICPAVWERIVRHPENGPPAWGPPGRIAPIFRDNGRQPEPCKSDQIRRGECLIRSLARHAASAQICRMYDEKPIAGGWTAYASEEGAESQGVS